MRTADERICRESAKGSSHATRCLWRLELGILEHHPAESPVGQSSAARRGGGATVARSIAPSIDLHGHRHGVGAYSASMKSITITLDDKTLDAGRAYAHRHHMTLDAVV